MSERYIANQQTESFPDLQLSSTALKHQTFFLWLIAIGLFIFLIMWLIMAQQIPFFPWDESANNVFAQLRQDLTNQQGNLARIFGRAGSQGITIVTIVILTVFAFRRQFRRFWLLFAAVVGVEFLWLPVVFTIGRPRPVEVRIIGDILLPGFPSGHVMIFIAFFGALLYLFVFDLNNRGLQILIVLVMVVLMLLTGTTRLLSGAHYFTDVIAGYGLGLAWTAFALLFVEWIFYKKKT